MAMKHCTEYVQGLCYKLRMMGIPCNEPSFAVYGDNMSVLKNGSLPDSVLKKKSNSSFAYNFVREGVTMNEWLLVYVNIKRKSSGFPNQAASRGTVYETSATNSIVSYLR